MVYVCLLICVQSDIDGPDDSDVLPLQANAMSFNVCNRDLCWNVSKTSETDDSLNNRRTPHVTTQHQYGAGVEITGSPSEQA